MTAKLEIGKLYTSPKYHLLVFPTEETAAAAVSAAWATISAAAAAVSAAAAWTGKVGMMAYWADGWSKKLNCHVSFILAGKVFCVVETGGTEVRSFHQVHVVAGEAMGWINVGDWLNIKELAA